MSLGLVAGLVALLAIFIYIIRKWFAGGVCRCKGDLKGKTVLVTGSTGGIGKETARLLAQRGARVVLTCRVLRVGAEVAKELQASTGNGSVVAMQLDLADLSNVRAFATHFLHKEPRLDILINNAGVYYHPPATTPDGHDLVFQTNHLGHFLLTKLLLERVKECQPSRIINVSSIAYEKLPKVFYFDNMDYRKTEEYGRHLVYAKSKLAQILFTRSLADQLRGSGVTVNVLHPGVVDTPIFKHFPTLSHPLWRTLFLPLIKLTFKTPWEGAQTTLHCAIAPEGATLSGVYFKDCAPYPLAAFAEDERLARYVWTLSERMIADSGLNQDQRAEPEAAD